MVSSSDTCDYLPDTHLLNSLIQSLPLNIYAKDRMGRFIFANSSYCRSVGKSRSGIIGKNDYEIHPGHMAEKYLADDRRIMGSGKRESIEESWQSIGGDTGFIQVIKAPLYDGAAIIGTIGLFWDITQRKKAEKELAEERNLLRTLIDLLPDYIYIKDLESRFIIGNKAVARAMGADSPDDLTGKTDFDFYDIGEASKFYNDEQKIVIDKESLFDIEECIRLENDEMIWLLTSKLPLKNLEDEVVGLVGIGHDITERKRVQKQLIHSQKMETVGTLTAGIAHDFNNLLNVINGYSEILQLELDDTDRHQNSVGKIIKAGKSAADLVNRLMMFSRKGVIQPEIVEFNDILVDTQQMLQRVLGTEIAVNMDLAPNLWRVKIDPTQAEQIIVNLATNARDAMPDGGMLCFATSNIVNDSLIEGVAKDISPGKYVRFSIKDTGTGIPEELYEKIFDPFFTTKQKHKGTGLGLATVFGIVEQVGGGITLSSDHGTVFDVYFPATNEVSELLPSEDLNIMPVGSETILVVEDESDVREMVSYMLTNQGYKVHLAENGKVAADVYHSLGRETIDLIITDIVMPEKNGKDLVEELELTVPDLKVLYMSGYTDNVIGEEQLASRRKAFLQKPFGPSELLVVVRELMDCC